MASNVWMILYLVAWLVCLVIYQRRRRMFDAGSFLLCTYVFYAFLSLLLLNHPEYSTQFKSLHLLPFVYLFLMLLLASSTVLGFNVRKFDRIQRPSEYLFVTVALLFVIPSLMHLPSSVANARTGILKMLIDTGAGDELYTASMEAGQNRGGGITNLGAIISSAFYNIGILFFFYYLTLPNRKKWLSAALLLSVLEGVLTYVSMGQRGGVILRLMTIVITYFAFAHFYPTRIRRVVRGFGIVLLILISVPIILLTVSRFGSKTGGSLGSLLYYSGQENLYFNNYALDDGGIRYGDRTMPLFKKMVGFRDVPDDFWERRDKYRHLSVDDEVFYTFVGDFTIDFGPWIAAILFLLFTFIFYRATRIRRRCLRFHQLVLIHFVMCVCAQGGMYLFSFSDTAGNLQIIVMIAAYLVFRLDYEERARRALMRKARISNRATVCPPMVTD